MVKYHDELNRQNVISPKSGEGKMTKIVLLDEQEMFSKGKTLAHLIFHPGCGMGYHEHREDTEFYYILSGTGEYNDGGEKKQVSSGDLCTVRSGNGHSLKNTGTVDLEVIALILYC